MNPKIILRYTLIGTFFGFVFPIISSLVYIISNRLPYNLSSIIVIHRNEPLQWIIDSAPLFLGLFAYIAGRAQERVNKLNYDLGLRLQENELLVNKLQKSELGLKNIVDRHVVQLRTAAKVATQAATYRDLNTLIQQTTNLISEQFGYYHVGIFLNDPANEYAVLQSSNSTGGLQMLARGHKLKIGESGIVGYVAGKGEPRIALDVGKDAVFFNNPDLPETRSEMSLPLKAKGKTMGVLDVQSRIEAAFDENDITTLQIIADSLATAIENIRLFDEIQTNLDEISGLNRQYLLSAWAETSNRSNPLQYTFEPKLSAPAEINDARTKRILKVPIKLRDQIIGTITLEADPHTEYGVNPNEWTPEELGLIEAATNQAALTLENTRLLEQTQRQAAQERIAANISSKIWAAPSKDAILRTALQQLANTLKATEGLVRLGADTMESSE